MTNSKLAPGLGAGHWQQKMGAKTMRHRKSGK